MAKAAAIRFRGKVYAASARHSDAMEAMFADLCKNRRERLELAWLIDEEKEPIEFGFAFDDGTEFTLSDMQGWTQALALRRLTPPPSTRR